MPAGEFADWQRYANTEPFGFPRDENRFGVLAANILAASGNKFNNSQITRPDFWVYKPPRVMSTMESLNMMKAMLPGSRRRKRRRIGY